MKNTNLSTKFSFLGLLLLLATFGQMQVLAQEKVRKSPNATVTQRVGLTDITITYCRPGVKGRTIWGDLVPYGMHPGVEFTQGREFPWRAGANENTTIKFSKDVQIEGEDLAAGIYGVHMIPGKEEWVVIFSKNSTSWGSYSYKAEEDVLRGTVTPGTAEHNEWLAYYFTDLTENSATLNLHWEKLIVPIKVEVASKSMAME